MLSIKPLAIAVVAVLALAACSSSGSTPTAAAPTVAPSAAATAAASSGGGSAAAATVDMKNIAYNPATVTAKVGQTVTWTNSDSFAHTVTFDDSSVKSSDNVAAAGTFSTTFDKAGSFTYHCTIHPTMKGTVTVS